MRDLTDEKYNALDELWTNNPPEVSGDGKSGFFMRHRDELVILDDAAGADAASADTGTACSEAQR